LIWSLLVCLLLDTSTAKTQPQPISQLSGSSDAQIEIAGWKLRKGVPKKDVLGSIPDVFKLTRMGDDDTWLVRESAHEDHLLATIQFKDECLSSITRLWAITDDDSSVDLSTHLLDLVERLCKDHGEHPRVVIRHIDRDGVTARQIQLIFGPRRLSFYVLDKVSDDGSHHQEVHLEEGVE